MIKRLYSSIPLDQQATILQSGMCRTIYRHRPAPSLFFFPGLTSKPIWNPSTPPFIHITKALQDNHHHILSEYQNIKKLASSDYNMTKKEEMTQKLHHGEWDWNSYILKGARQSDFLLKCPKTTEILESFTSSPSLMLSTPFSYAFFSTLKAQSTIQAHYGPCNLRIRCHYPLIIPPGDVGMRIAGNEYRWEVGKPLYFDDSFEHEVWNQTNEERVVLLFDVWHPNLFADEIEAITNMFTHHTASKQKNQ